MMGVVKLDMNRVNPDGTLEMTNLFANPSAAQLFNQSSAESITGLKGTELGWSSEEVKGFQVFQRMGTLGIIWEQKHYVESFQLGVPVVFEFCLVNKKKRKRSIQLDVTWGEPDDMVRNFIEISLNVVGGYVDFCMCESYWGVKIYIFMSRHYFEKTIRKVSETSPK
jgi:hypothetical protein